jgi:hypothetical protein
MANAALFSGTLNALLRPGWYSPVFSLDHLGCKYVGRKTMVLKRVGWEPLISKRIGDPVATGLAKATNAWAEYKENREFDRDAIYGYLQTVFDLVQQWKTKGVADERSLEALKRQDFPIKIKADAYARIVCCTSDAGPKFRSKWANVMQWVARRNKKGRSFTEFVKNNGGLNECADNAANDWDPDWT